MENLGIDVAELDVDDDDDALACQKFERLSVTPGIVGCSRCRLMCVDQRLGLAGVENCVFRPLLL